MKLRVMFFQNDVVFRRISISDTVTTFEECNLILSSIELAHAQWKRLGCPEVPPEDPMQYFETSDIFIIDEETGKEYWKNLDGFWYVGDGPGISESVIETVSGQALGPVYIAYTKNLEELARCYGCSSQQMAKDLITEMYGDKDILIHMLI